MADELMYAWAAGFLDGEGCFGLYGSGASKNVHKATRQPTVSATQVDPAPLLRLTLMFGGKIRRQSRNAPACEWRLTSAAKVIEVVPLVLPYLTVKKGQAECVLEYAKLMNHRGRYYDDENAAARMLLIERFDSLRRPRKMAA
jgi:hypothetical protein